uniref:Bifunctional inhibitor/plant lipid transfer protein/seed storage helical domain-containing protein n=1 Tax=Vitis vinifera TaxID=29760 RepID=F6GX95_VITVI
MPATNVSYMTWVLVAAMLFSGSDIVSGQCQGSIQDLKICVPYVQKKGPKIPPSQACCDAIKGVDILCVCHHLPPDIGELISIEKVVFVLQVCREPLAPGTKCGSKNIKALLS